MAGLAADPLVDVNAVVEIDEVGEIVDAVPLESGIVAEAGAHRLEHGRLTPDLGVTGHTGFGGGNAGKTALVDGRVAIATVEAHPGNVMLVTKGDRLLERDVLFGDEIRPIDIEQDPHNGTDGYQAGHNASFGSPIGAAREYLSHLSNPR